MKKKINISEEVQQEMKEIAEELFEGGISDDGKGEE